MDAGLFILSTVIGGVILFFWIGFTQNVLPWGIKSVKEVPQESGLGEKIASITTDGMRLIGGKQAVTVFMAIKPAHYDVMPRYFAIEFVTQMLVAAVLSGILLFTSGLPDTQRLLLIGLVGMAGIASVDVQYWNWWGFSTIYTLGVAISRLTGYLIAAGVLLAWVM